MVVRNITVHYAYNPLLDASKVILPRLVWRRTGKPLTTKTLHFNDFLPPPPTLQVQSVTAPHSDTLTLYRQTKKRQLRRIKWRSMSPVLPLTPTVSRLRKVLPRLDERNKELLGRPLSRQRKSQPKKVPPELLNSEQFIDEMVSARRCINFASIPPRLSSQGPTPSNLKALLLESEGSSQAGNLTMLKAVRGLESMQSGTCKVDTRISSSFLEPSRQWNRREKGGWELRRPRPSPSPILLTPASALKQHSEEVESRLQAAVQSCEAFVEALSSHF